MPPDLSAFGILLSETVAVSFIGSQGSSRTVANPRPKGTIEKVLAVSLAVMKAGARA